MTNHAEITIREIFEKKLRSTRGDSITEVLVASLIGALSLILLAGMITAAGRMITKSSKAFDDYYEASSALAEAAEYEEGGSAVTGTVKLTTKEGVTEKIADDTEIPVKIYVSGGEETVLTYRSNR